MLDSGSTGRCQLCDGSMRSITSCAGGKNACSTVDDEACRDPRTALPTAVTAGQPHSTAVPNIYLFCPPRNFAASCGMRVLPTGAIKMSTSAFSGIWRGAVSDMVMPGKRSGEPTRIQMANQKASVAEASHGCVFRHARLTRAAAGQ